MIEAKEETLDILDCDDEVFYLPLPLCSCVAVEELPRDSFMLHLFLFGSSVA